MNISDRGFTFIDLVVVMLIITALMSVLSARVASLQEDARAAEFLRARMGFTSAVRLVHAKWRAGGTAAAGTITLNDGMTIRVNESGWPTIAPSDPSQNTAKKLYSLLMTASLPSGWPATEVPAVEAGTATYTLTGAGGGSFTYDAAIGTIN